MTKVHRNLDPALGQEHKYGRIKLIEINKMQLIVPLTMEQLSRHITFIYLEREVI